MKQRIIGAIDDSARDADQMVSRGGRGLQKQIEGAVENLQGELKRQPTQKEIEVYLNWPDRVKRRYQTQIAPITSGIDRLDARVDTTGEGDLSMYDQLEDVMSGYAPRPRKLDSYEQAELVMKILELPGMDLAKRYKSGKPTPSSHLLQEVLIMYEVEGKQLQEIADMLNLTASRVSQIRTEALSIIRDHLEKHPDYWQDVNLTL